MTLFNRVFFFRRPDDDTGGGSQPSTIDKAIDRGELSDGGSQDTGGEATQTTQTGTQGTQGQQGQSNQQGTGRSSVPNTGTRQGQGQQGQRTQGGGASDLRLPDGTVIPGGPARRFYEDLQRTRNELQQTSGQVQQYTQRISQLEGELNGFRQSSQVLQQLGLTPQEATVGYNFVSEFKKDAVGTVKKLLEHVRSQGHNVEGLGTTVDMGAIQRLIQQQLLPITQHYQQNAQEAQLEQQIAQQVGQFYTRYSDARIHEPMIAEMLNRDPNLSLDAAYYQLRLWVNTNGLDWTQPLAPQIQARSNGQGQQGQQTTTHQTIPNGRGGASQFNGRTVDGQSRSASADTSWDDIVAETLREHGMRT